MKTPSCLDGIDFTKNNTIVIAVNGLIYVKKRHPDNPGRFLVTRQKYDAVTEEWVDYDPTKLTTADRRVLVHFAQKDNVSVADVARLLGVSVSTVTGDLTKK